MSTRCNFTFLLIALAALTCAQAPNQGQDFTNLPLEDLMKVDVTDAFKSPMPLMKVPAAIYVITQEDIKRAGARSIPEALRLVPGVEVSRIGTAYYSVAIGGFDNQISSNKLLVLLDGRTLYSPNQNTVYWEIEDVVMDNIDRIEVIIGPGGSLWGANAVNGVINILTKNSKDTQGGLAEQSIGDLERNQSVIQYGGRFSDDGTFRVYGKYGVDHASDNQDSTSYGDSRELNILGFRTDFDLKNQSSLMVQGETAQFRLAENQFVPLVVPPYSATFTNTDLAQTGHILAKWDHTSPNGAYTAIQGYYDLLDYPYTDQASTGALFDLSVDHRFAESRNHNVAIGGGYRYMINGTTAGPSAINIPLSRRDTIFNTYIQDIINLTPMDLLTVGAKLEYNNYTGIEFEPNIRYAHTPDNNRTLWASVGRAVRTPSQDEANLLSLETVNPGNPGQPLQGTATEGNPNLGAESLIANEIGYREKLNDHASIDLSAFYNIYNNLIYLAPGTPFNTNVFGPEITIDPSVYENGDHGQTYGFDAAAKYAFSPNLKADFTFTAIQRSHFVQGTDLGCSRYQASVHLAWDPIKSLELDGILHWYDAIPEQQVSAYTKLDLHLTWKISDSQEFSLGGYDLLAGKHLEFGQSGYIPRSFVAEMKIRF
jgi:iron complex outermembrane receptor protein